MKTEISQDKRRKKKIELHNNMVRSFGSTTLSRGKDCTTYFSYAYTCRICVHVKCETYICLKCVKWYRDARNHRVHFGTGGNVRDFKWRDYAMDETHETRRVQMQRECRSDFGFHLHSFCFVAGFYFYLLDCIFIPIKM